MFNVPYLNELRVVEMERLVPLIPKGARVLEFGAGTGQQARFLADRGFDVVAIDMATSKHAEHLQFPVQPYDGEHIPLPDKSVDVAFSSNVLEHVENLPAIMSEFRRVLRPGGFGLHIMPTTSWRFWSFVTGLANSAVVAAHVPGELIKPPKGHSRLRSLGRNLKFFAGGILPIGHGASWEGISELYTFSRRYWLRTFNRYGFDVVEDMPLGLFYTGHMLLGKRIPFDRRSKLSNSLGSATHIYVVRPLSGRA